MNVPTSVMHVPKNVRSIRKWIIAENVLKHAGNVQKHVIQEWQHDLANEKRRASPSFFISVNTEQIISCKPALSFNDKFMNYYRPFP
jgi:hypothetical protein